MSGNHETGRSPIWKAAGVESKNFDRANEKITNLRRRAEEHRTRGQAGFVFMLAAAAIEILGEGTHASLKDLFSILALTGGGAGIVEYLRASAKEKRAEAVKYAALKDLGSLD